MVSLAEALSQELGRTVLDKTRLEGAYDFTLQWAPDDSQSTMFKGSEEGGQSTPASLPGSSVLPFSLRFRSNWALGWNRNEGQLASLPSIVLRSRLRTREMRVELSNLCCP